MVDLIDKCQVTLLIAGTLGASTMLEYIPLFTKIDNICLLHVIKLFILN